MKYLKTYNKVFEGMYDIKNKYYIKEKYWDYEIGYVWSPNHRDSSVYRDPSVISIKEERDGGSLSLVGEALGDVFKDYMGVSDMGDLCMIHPDTYQDRNSEFHFFRNGLVEERLYAIVENPDAPGMIVKQIEPSDRHYTEIIKELIGRDFTEQERKDKENHEGISSWHVEIKLYEQDGIKYLSESLGGTEGFIFNRNDVEKVMDKTKSCNYYRYDDKESQIVRIRGKEVHFLNTRDIFIDLSDHGLEMVDFSWSGMNELMIQFKKSDIHITPELINDVKEAVSRFSDLHDCALKMMRVTRNHVLYTNKSSVIKREVIDISTVNRAAIGRLDRLNHVDDQYNVRTREHSFFFLFII
jgi:hypothetical protein